MDLQETKFGEVADNFFRILKCESSKSKTGIYNGGG